MKNNSRISGKKKNKTSGEITWYELGSLKTLTK